MRSLTSIALVAMPMALLASGAVVSQPQAPEPTVEFIRGVKTTEPLTVLEKRFTAQASEFVRAIRPVAEDVFAAVTADGITVLPNHATVVVFASMQEMMQGGELNGALRVPITDDFEPGELAGHADIKVVRVEPQLVGYTYGKGDLKSVAQARFPVLAMWLMGRGHIATGPFHVSVFQNPAQTTAGETVCEVQVVIEKPEEPPAARP